MSSQLGHMIIYIICVRPARTFDGLLDMYQPARMLDGLQDMCQDSEDT